MEKWKSIEKGYLGQLIVEKAFLKNNFSLYRPILENGKIDLIAEKNNILFRLQIKTVINDHGKRIPLRKISHNMGKYKITLYTKKEIDYFIGVDLETEDLYLLPIEFSQTYSNSISINKCIQYKNNFDQLELFIRNNKNEGNDNVETLTDNADGKDVGTEKSGRERVDNFPPK